MFGSENWSWTKQTAWKRSKVGKTKQCYAYSESKDTKKKHGSPTIQEKMARKIWIQMD